LNSSGETHSRVGEAESHAVIEANSVKTKRTQHSFFQHSIGTKTGLGDDDEGYGDAARIVERMFPLLALSIKEHLLTFQ
jgi:hypothetical protein